MLTIQEFEEDSGMKRIISIIFVLCLAVTMNVSAYFPDVSESNADERAIFDVYSLGIMQGYEDGTFRADNNVTRAEFAKIAMAMQGITIALQSIRILKILIQIIGQADILKLQKVKV